MNGRFFGSSALLQMSLRRVLARTPRVGAGRSHTGRGQKEFLHFLFAKVLKDLQRESNFHEQLDLKLTFGVSLVLSSSIINSHKNAVSCTPAICPFSILLLYSHHFRRRMCLEVVNVGLQLWFLFGQAEFQPSQNVYFPPTRVPAGCSQRESWECLA